MNKQLTKKLALALAQIAPRFTYGDKSKAIFITPVDSIFRGMIFDSSGFSSNTFSPYCFVMPLYLPAKMFTMNIGRRLGGNWLFEEGKELKIASDLMRRMNTERIDQLFNDLSCPEGIIANLHKYHPDSQDPFFQRTVSYSNILCAKIDVGISGLDSCVKSLRALQVKQPGVLWHQILIDEVTELYDLVMTDNSLAILKLNTWAETTRAALRLPL